MLHIIGLLHSDICGSFRACQSPQLFAAYRVLLRLLMPRHPPLSSYQLKRFFAELCLVSKNFFLGEVWNCNFPSIEFYFFKLDILISSLLFRYSIFKDQLTPQTFEVLGMLFFHFWWAKMDSNHRPLGYQPSALTSWAISPSSYLSFATALQRLLFIPTNILLGLGAALCR